jgi:heme-degrading monooxygenase HmoA
MITRIVKMTFKPKEIGAFIDNFDAVKHKIRDFEGCEKVLLLQDIANPSIYFTYSWWQSEADLNNYRNSELFKGVWSFTKSLFAAKAEAWSVTEKARL